MRRLTLFCHFDKDNLIDDYVVTYLQGLKQIASDIYFVSNSLPSACELKKIEPYVKNITLRKNTGLDFGAWKEVILTLGLPYIASHYDELILANDSCYGPFSPFSDLFTHMSNKNYDMWGITENCEPYYVSENGEVIDIPPHIQSYFLVFNKTILQAACFSTFWNNVNNLACRDGIILNNEIGLTTLLKDNGFYCGAFIQSQTINTHNLKNIHGVQLYDLSLFCWYELLHHQNPLLKVKAIPLTLNMHKKYFQNFKRNYPETKGLCSFLMVDKHLKRTSISYRLAQISWLKKITAVILYILFRKPANSTAIVIFHEYKAKICKNLSQGGIRQIIKKIYRIVLHKALFKND
ncbi:MAG: rhamnan synthesis F family protein [Pseudomonadota bacterium]